MFRKLRNRLILTNLGITSVVILMVFTAIYMFSTRSADNRPPIQSGELQYNDEVTNLIIFSVREEKQVAANQLLTALIVSGVAIEVIVAFVSYYLAEEAIKPVREAYESQKIFIANASHEIKTPLAAIAANLEAADIQDNKWIDNVEKETAKLAGLNNELLALARTDLVNETVEREVNLGEMVADNLKGFEPRLQGVDFRSELQDTGNTKINVADFLQILSVLMDNAIKYAGSQIDVSLTNHELAVTNDGTTIATEDLKHIFDRFYQADKSAEGVGLGLSIAKTVAERNNWQLTAESDDETTSFRLKF